MRNSKYRIQLGIGFGVLIIIGTALLMLVTRMPFSPEVVDTNRYAVLYSDNTAEFIFRNTYENDMQVYKAPIQPLHIDEEKSGQGWGPVRYTLPEVTLRGTNKERSVFTVGNGIRIGYLCDTNIVYVDHVARTSHTAETPWCIAESLDQDYTRFWSQEYVSYSQTESPYFNIGVGDYVSGRLIASTSVTIPIWTDGVSSIGSYGINPSSVVSNTEMTKVVFAFTAGPECGDYRGECDTPAYIYMFDLKSGTVRDVTPEKGVTFKKLHPDGDLSGSLLHYVQDDSVDPTSGRFIILRDNGYFDPYAVIDVDTIEP